MNQIKIFSYLGLLFLSPIYLSAQSENAIEVREAYKYVGETKIVCGKIVSTKYLKRASGGPIFLNFGRDHPNQQMTGLIWFGRFSEYFSYKPEKFLKRKTSNLNAGHCLLKLLKTYFLLAFLFLY